MPGHMPQVAILLPATALVAVTAVVWIAMLVQRARHMSRHDIKPQDVPSRAVADAKFGDAQATNNALMNLFEVPVLFYVLCVVLLVTGTTDQIFMSFAWLYVSLRAVQAAVHVTYNDVLHRGLAYLTSTTLLWLAWIRLAWKLFVA